MNTLAAQFEGVEYTVDDGSMRVTKRLSEAELRSIVGACYSRVVLYLHDWLASPTDVVVAAEGLTRAWNAHKTLVLPVLWPAGDQESLVCGSVESWAESAQKRAESVAHHFAGLVKRWSASVEVNVVAHAMGASVLAGCAADLPRRAISRAILVAPDMRSTVFEHRQGRRLLDAVGVLRICFHNRDFALMASGGCHTDQRLGLGPLQESVKSLPAFKAGRLAHASCCREDDCHLFHNYAASASVVAVGHSVLAVAPPRARDQAAAGLDALDTDRTPLPSHLPEALTDVQRLESLVKGHTPRQGEESHLGVFGALRQGRSAAVLAERCACVG